ncbi:unnamed protein product [Alopecurus aequalis]
MASGMEDEEQTEEETEWECDGGDDDEEEGSAAAVFGDCMVVSVLFETPSGFAIFGYDRAKLTRPDAWKHVWADFACVPIKAIIWLKAFQTFEDKACAVNTSTVSPELATMIRKYVVNGQSLAVEKEDYKKVIQEFLGIRCVYGTAPVRELMWGLMFQMQRLVPAENSELANEDRFPVSQGMGYLLNDTHKFGVNQDMMVTKRIIEMASLIYECDYCVNKYDNILRFAAEHQILKISRIDTREWDLLKLATALKMICYPEEEIPAARRLFRKHQLRRFMNDAPRYEGKICKADCLEIYNEMYNARKTRLEAAKVLVRLVRRAKKAYETEQAGAKLQVTPTNAVEFDSSGRYLAIGVGLQSSQ